MSTTGGARLGLGLLVLAVVATLALLAPAAKAQPVAAPPVTIDGPSAAIVGSSGLAVARDGSGGIVYLKQVGGVSKVFVSRLINGTFQLPQQVDASLPGASSQPVIAAANGGVLLVAFINGGSLYVVQWPSATLPYVPPQLLSAGASNPQIQMSNFGKAYLAFTAVAPGGYDVRCAYYYNGQWALEGAPLNAVAGDNAGTGVGAPDVAAAGDGVGIVVWGENGHVFARRVWDTSPSVAYEQADVPTLKGWTEVSAGEPSVGAGGDSSYAPVVFQETLTNGVAQQSRVLMNRLHGALFDGVTEPDGISSAVAAGADQPEISDSEYGRGIVTSERTDSHQLWASLLGNSGATAATLRVDSLQNVTAPDATSGMDGLNTGFVAWQQIPGSVGPSEIRARFYNGSRLGPEQVLSSPAFGPTDAPSGLATAGDVAGDAAVAWVQGTGSGTRIVAAQLYQPPPGFALSSSFRYVRTLQPRLSWSGPKDPWGPLSYQVSVDGVQVGQPSVTALTVPFALSQGPHVWDVTAVDPAGLSSTARPATVWVDTVAPAVTLKLTGRKRAGSVLHVYLGYTDSPPPVPRADASGVASVVVKWGDGTSYRIAHGKFHVYARPGRYKLSVIVKDKAGNTTTVVRVLKIAAKTKTSAKAKPKSSSNSTTGGAHA